MMKILKGFVSGDIIEAAGPIQLPDDREVCRGRYRYRICDGVHRYFASIAAVQARSNGFSLHRLKTICNA
jgi:hypothetical protein